MSFGGHASGLHALLGSGILVSPGCTYELLARFNAANQGFANGQVLDTAAEGVTAGQLTVVEVDGTLAIVGNECAFTAQGTPTWGDLGLYSQAVVKALGKSLAGIFNLSTWEEAGIAWHTAAAIADPDNAPFAIQANATNGRLDKQGGSQIASGLAQSTNYPFHLVLGGYDVNGVPWDSSLAGAGYLYGAALFLSISSTWTLLWRESSDNTATLYAMLSLLDAVGTLDDFRVPTYDYSAVLQPTVKDAFTDANGTLLPAHTPDISLGAWVNNVGAWDIQTNRAQPPAVTATVHIATTTGLAEAFYRVQGHAGQAGTDARVGLMFRFTDTNNYWWTWLEAYTAGPSIWSIYERNGGVGAQRATIAGPNPSINTTYELTVTTDGTAMQAWLNGTYRLAWASALHQSATGAGLRSRYTGAITNDNWFDNFHCQPRDGYTELDECP